MNRKGDVGSDAKKNSPKKRMVFFLQIVLAMFFSLCLSLFSHVRMFCVSAFFQQHYHHFGNLDKILIF